MSDNIFIDTNILVYAFLDNEPKKHEQAVNLLAQAINKEVFVSTQVFSELYSALSKNGVEHDAIEQYLIELDEQMNLTPIDFQTIIRCLKLKKRYGFSYWDSLILASALEGGCSVVYSEDMQDGQRIEGELTIKNPFGNESKER